MDKTVPGPAALLLDLIGRVEAPRGYETFFGNGDWPKRLTTMTVDEMINSGEVRKIKFGSSAAGRYQFMAATLSDLKKQLRLRGEQVMNPDLQDRLAYHLLRRRGYDKWIRNQISHDDFMIGLAKEWASFPVPYEMRGASRTLSRGQSYYAGDGLNKALIGATEVWKALDTIRRGATVIVPPIDPEEPPPMADAAYEERVKNVSIIVSGILAKILPEIIRQVVAESVHNPNVPIESARPTAAAYSISTDVMDRVTAEVAKIPEVQHATNTEPWYQSRVTVGNLVSALSAILAAYGVTTTPDQQLAATEVIGALGILFGNALSLYGRWVARKPLGT